MCGIAGISAARPISEGALEAAGERLSHRGPDGSGQWISPDRQTGFAHRRLAILDLSPAGHQPMTSADGRYVITYNGEIYNFAELRAALRSAGVSFRSNTDTEVLLEGYARFGPAVLDRLNGIFAFAIYDVTTREVFVARDHMGVKPLYYSVRGGQAAFASELKSLIELAPGADDIDVTAIRRYVTFLWCPGDRTPLKSVKRLEPGQAMLIKDGRLERLWTYWTPPAYAPRRDWSARECAAELRGTLEAAVQRQMVADVPVGAFLSGGLDSSAVVAAARHAAPDIRAFSIDLVDGAEAGSTDDLPFARRAAEHLGVKLDVVRVDSQSLAAGVAEMVWALDEPLADPATLNAYYISRLARETGVKVLLSGAGGDDLFTGYRRHAVLAWAPYWAGAPRSLRRGLKGVADRIGQTSAAGRRLSKALDFLEQDNPVPASFAWGPPGIADQLINPDRMRSEQDRAAEDVYAPMDALLERVADAPTVEQCLELERRFFLSDHNLTYTDKMSMAVGVEARVPLIDLEMVRFASTVPTEWKLRGGCGKWIMKKSQEGILPNDIIYRPKTGFGAPLRSWMKTDIRPLVDELLSEPVLNARGLFDPAVVHSLRRADAEGRVDASYTLFSLMCIELWCRCFIDSPGRGQPGA